MVSKGLKLSYEKCLQDTINAPITKEQGNFRNIKYVTYTITNNKIALRKVNDKEILDKDGITRYPLGSNTPFIKCFDDEDVPNPIEELKKLYKKFIKNGQLWWYDRRKHKRI